MGEIGIPRRDFLFEIKYWEVLRIIAGYRRRSRTSLLLSRLQTFWLVKCSMAKTDRVKSPSDLWPLPWDDEDDDTPVITVEEQADLSALITSLNSNNSED